jgi:hypothetical protein
LSIQRGNIVLFKNPIAWYEHLICATTGGPYFHVAIATDATHIIAATGHGILISLAPINPNTYDAIAIDPPADCDRGLVWAIQQRGKQYGWADIVYQAIKFLAPNNPLQIVSHDHWDCSDFATRYLQEADYPLPTAFSDPYQNTPNDIARVFGLIPMRKVVHA